jgi:hypothetical protein
MNLVGGEAIVLPIEAVLKVPVGSLTLSNNLDWIGPLLNLDFAIAIQSYPTDVVHLISKVQADISPFADHPYLYSIDAFSMRRSTAPLAPTS